jgi:hypothetical protein
MGWAQRKKQEMRMIYIIGIEVTIAYNDNQRMDAGPMGVTVRKEQVTIQGHSHSLSGLLSEKGEDFARWVDARVRDEEERRDRLQK